MNLGISVNDIHSGMNATRVARVAQIRTEAQAAEEVTQAANSGVAVTACGGRHAMGGQQFGDDTVLLDMSALASVGSVDSTRGLVECGAGVTWPSLIRELLAQQQDNDRPWTIRQKQTGADRLSIGGALAANIHGRGLKMRPFVEDIEAFNLVDASGLIRRCSRSENTELFRLAIGGYGLLGVVTSVCLRLSRRLKLERVVEIALVEDLMAKFESRIADGFLFGDFQFAIDERSTDFLRRGIFS